MGFAQNIWQLVALRSVQGMLTGTVPAATTLVASSAPRERSGYAVGLLQMAVWTGASVGPLLGGYVADTWGYRAAFWVTGALLFVAGLTVWRLVEEDFTPPEPAEDEEEESIWYGLRLVVRERTLLSLFSIRIVVRLAIRVLSPILPLFVQSLLPSSARVATVTGWITGARAATSAVGAVTIGRASDRLGYRRVLMVCALLCALLYVPQFFVTASWQLLVLQALVGLVMSGVLASISALLANLAPEGDQGAVYGADSSAVSVANAIGPMVGASVAAAFGLRIPFLFVSGAFFVAVIMAWFLVPTAGQAKAA
jgi:DHA1 family multidrug resistance protein-like MFS transporter